MPSTHRTTTTTALRLNAMIDRGNQALMVQQSNRIGCSDALAQYNSQTHKRKIPPINQTAGTHPSDNQTPDTKSAQFRVD
jgi:hypothetical protein